MTRTATLPYSPEFSHCTWETKKGSHERGSVFYLGRWRVGMTVYEPNRRKWAAVSMLPGLKHELGYFDTEDMAMKKVETSTSFWVNDINIPREEEPG